MIAYLKGKIIEIKDMSVVMLIDSIGYEVFLPTKDLLGLKEDDELELHTEFIVREDDMKLFGFMDSQDKKMFNLLKEVSGVGPKMSLNMLSSLEAEVIIKAILEEDIKMLVKLPGVGKKTAQRIILDIKEKIEKASLNFSSNGVKIKSDSKFDLEFIYQALETLGYQRKEISRIIPELEKLETHDEQVLVKQALKLLTRY